MRFGEFIRLKREEKNLLLRELASKLEIDQALLSKIERGERPLHRDYLAKTSKVLNVPSKELQTIWLSDKLLNELEGFKYKIEALEMAKQNVNGLK